MKPIISVIVPVHNDASYLVECLDSIRNQTFKSFEVIIVNDGSSDESGNICDRYSEIDIRFKVIHKEFGGVSAARNTGLKHVQGDYIGFVDGDDRIDSRMYEILYNLVTNYRSDIAICKLGREIEGKLINENLGEEQIITLSNLEGMSELFKGNLYRFSLCNKLFKYKCFKEIKFHEGRIHEDLSTTYKLFSNATKSVFTDYVGYIYVKRSNSILTTDFSERRMDALKGWQEITNYMKKDYQPIMHNVISTLTYGSVDYIYYILNEVKIPAERDHYLLLIQKWLRGYFWEIQKNENLNFKYKFTIFIFCMNIKAFLSSSKMKMYLNS